MRGRVDIRVHATCESYHWQPVCQYTPRVLMATPIFFEEGSMLLPPPCPRLSSGKYHCWILGCQLLQQHELSWGPVGCWMPPAEPPVQRLQAGSAPSSRSWLPLDAMQHMVGAHTQCVPPLLSKARRSMSSHTGAANSAGHGAQRALLLLAGNVCSIGTRCAEA